MKSLIIYSSVLILFFTGFSYLKAETLSYNVTNGSVLTINASDITEITQFNLKPKVYITNGNLLTKKKSIKVLNSGKEIKEGLSSIRCQLKGKVSSGTYDLYIQTIVNEAKIDILITTLFIVEPPDIFILTPDTGETDDEITVRGKYFGCSPPKLWLQYDIDKNGKTKTKKKRCKIKKPFEYSDAKDKEGRSCMNVTTGESKLIFYVPKNLPENTKLMLYLTNKIGLATHYFNDTSTDYTISGTISGDVQEGITLSLSGTSEATTTSGSDGTYTFSGLTNGTYTVTPSLSSYEFSPSYHYVTIAGESMSSIDFTVGASSDDEFAGIQLAYSSDTTEVTLAWVKASDTKTGTNNYKYKIYRSTTDDFKTVFQPENLISTFTGVTGGKVGELDAGTKYYFMIVAEDENGNQNICEKLAGVLTMKTPMDLESKPKELEQIVTDGKFTVNEDGTRVSIEGDYTSNSGKNESEIFSKDDVLVIPFDTSYLLRKVTDVAFSGGLTDLALEAISVSQIVKSGEVCTTQIMSSIDELEESSSLTEPKQKLFQQKFRQLSRKGYKVYVDPEGKFMCWERAYPAKGIALGNKRTLTLTSGIDFSYTPTFTPEISSNLTWSSSNKWKLDKAEINAKGTFKIEGNVTYSINAENEISPDPVELFSNTRLSFYWIGYLPVWQETEISILGKVKCTTVGELGLTTDLTLAKELDMSVVWEKDTGWSTSKNDSFTKSFTHALTGEAGLDIELTIYPQITVRLYRQAEVGLAVMPTVTMDADLQLLPRTYFSKFDLDFKLLGNVTASLNGIDDTIASYSSGDFSIIDPVNLLSLPSVSFSTAPTTGFTNEDNVFAVTVTDGTNNPVSTDDISWSVSPDSTISLSNYNTQGTFKPTTADDYTVTTSIKGTNTSFLGDWGIQQASTSITISESDEAPTVTTSDAGNVSSTTATLNGSVDPNELLTTYYFEYGTTTSYGTKTTSKTITSALSVSEDITGILPNTTYHFRLVATNTKGTSYGDDKTFTTINNNAPTVTTTGTSFVGSTDAEVEGTVNPNGLETTYYFQYGTTTGYGSNSDSLSAGSGTTAVDCGMTLFDLTANTTYHFRTVATNADGTSYGEDKTFTTDP